MGTPRKIMTATPAAPRSVLRREPHDRERIARELAERMDGPVTVLGVIFLLLVLADTVAEPQGAVRVAFDVTSWAIWGVFVLEFVLRAVIAPSTWGFLRRNWWQLVFLAVPFLRFARILARLRVGRVGRVVSSAVRTSRTAAAELSTRLGWLSAVTVIVILAASQLLYEFGEFDRYAQALHAAALATITGEPIASPSGFARIAEVVLATYSVVVFASLAGMLGAYFLEQRAAGRDRQDIEQRRGDAV